MHLRKTLVAIALVAAATLALVPATPAVAQEVVQDEGAAYRAWHDANQAGDNAKAMAAAKAYIAQYPTGEYADFITKWFGTAQMTALDAAIKEKRTADMIAVGREILAADPENLNVLYALAFNIRRNELLAAPPNFTNAPAAVELGKKAIALMESGKTLTGVATFDKNATLAWLTQILAVNERRTGVRRRPSSSREVDLAGTGGSLDRRANLLAVVSLRQAKYASSPRPTGPPGCRLAAPEPKPEVKAAKDALNARPTASSTPRPVRRLREGRNLPAATGDRVNQLLDTVYKSRFPEDTTLAGLKKILQGKEAAVGVPPPPGELTDGAVSRLACASRDAFQHARTPGRLREGRVEASRTGPGRLSCFSGASRSRHGAAPRTLGERIAAVQTEIRRAEADEGRFGDGSKSLVSLGLATLRRTLAVLDQRRRRAEPTGPQ